MTPAARVQAAIELLDDILGGSPAEKALTGWARRSRFAGSKDRAAVRDHVFDALRRRNSAAARGGAKTGRGLMLGVLRQDGLDPADLFTGQGHAPAPLTGAEQVDGGGDALDLPDWLEAPLRDRLGTGFDAEMALMRARAPVCLRVNLRKASRSDVQAELAAEGIETRPMALADTALEVTQGARQVAQSAAYREGRVELQDVSSQAAMAALPLRPGMRVLDYCAGGGGKLLAMAGRIDGEFWAHDANPRRMGDLPARAARAGVQAGILARGDASERFDLVLCDVPCSGSGTWRRTPDAKWKFTAQDLEKLMEGQDSILLEATRFVAPGGVLAYTTCSLLEAENEARVAAFVAAHADWRLVQQRQLTLKDGGDGFFHAWLTRE